MEFRSDKVEIAILGFADAGFCIAFSGNLHFSGLSGFGFGVPNLWFL